MLAEVSEGLGEAMKGLDLRDIPRNSVWRKEAGKVGHELSIGVLALQGSVEEHLRLLASCEGVRPYPVKTADALAQADGLILPGGESTAIALLLHDFQLFEPLKQRIRKGLPVWGTCAGLILLARRIVGEPSHLDAMDITVRRNAYGRQIDSFSATASLPEVADHPPLTFIRAPGSKRRGGRTGTAYPGGTHNRRPAGTAVSHLLSSGADR